MNLKKAARWTPFVFFKPEKYIERGEWWKNFDFPEWSRNEYEWVSDGWSGYRDFAQKPSQTVQKGTGDCEDLALVAASWALENDRSPVRIGFCWERWTPHPTHVICYDGEGWVYSSGSISYDGVREWLSESDYKAITGRLVE